MKPRTLTTSEYDLLTELTTARNLLVRDYNYLRHTNPVAAELLRDVHLIKLRGLDRRIYEVSVTY